MKGLIKNPIVTKASGQKELKEIMDAEESLTTDSKNVGLVELIGKRLAEHPELSEYLQALFYKDPIEQLYVYQHASETAKVALKELFDAVSKDQIAAYQSIIGPLKEKVEAMEKKHQELVASYNDLYQQYQSKFDDVSRRIGVLDRELAKKNEELAQKKEELSRLSATKPIRQIDPTEHLSLPQMYNERMLRVIEEHKRLIKARHGVPISLETDKKKKLHNHIKKGDKVVVWEKVKDNDPILNMNWREMDNYIGKVMNKYLEFRNGGYSCFDEFYNKSPRFGELINWFLEGKTGRYPDIYLNNITREIAKTLCLPKYYIKYMGTLLPLEFNTKDDLLDKEDYLITSDKHHK